MQRWKMQAAKNQEKEAKRGRDEEKKGTLVFTFHIKAKTESYECVKRILSEEVTREMIGGRGKTHPGSDTGGQRSHLRA